MLKALVSARLSPGQPRTPRFLRTLLALLVAAAAGCVEVEHSMVLKADGSGTLDFRYAVPVEEVRRWEGLQAETGLSGETTNRSWAAFDEASVRAAFAELDPERVVLRDVFIGEAAGWRTIRMTVGFRDFDALAEANLLDRSQVSLQPTETGDYVFAVRVGDPALQWAAGSPEARQQMEAEGHGFSLALRLELPGAIVETNGRKLSDRAVEWNVEGVTGEKGLLEAARNGPRVVFHGEGLQMPSFGQQHVRLPGPGPAP